VGRHRHQRGNKQQSTELKGPANECRFFPGLDCRKTFCFHCIHFYIFGCLKHVGFFLQATPLSPSKQPLALPLVPSTVPRALQYYLHVITLFSSVAAGMSNLAPKVSKLAVDSVEEKWVLFQPRENMTDWNMLLLNEPFECGQYVVFSIIFVTVISSSNCYELLFLWNFMRRKILIPG